jgi:hypothetical protein
MKRSIIILAIMGISISATTMTMAQDRRRTGSRQSVHVNSMAGNDILAARRTATKRTVKDGTSNTMMGVYVAAGDVNGDGRSNVRRTESVDKNESITIGGGRTERNGLIVNGTGGNDQASLQNRRTNTNLVQGNYIGTDAVTTRGSASNILSGTPTANGTFSKQSNSVVFEGNDEPLWARTRRNAAASQVTTGIDIILNGAASKNKSQSLGIGTTGSTPRTRITGVFDSDGDVDGNDFLRKPRQQQ